MAVKKQPAITGLHSQGIVDDIIKIGVKGTKKAVGIAVKNKRYVSKTVKSEYPTGKQLVKSGKMTPLQAKGIDKKVVKTLRNDSKSAYKRSGATGIKSNIRRAANKG